jgi:hypothetical protein
MAAFANSYTSDDYIYRFSPSQNCDGVFKALKTCLAASSSFDKEKEKVKGPYSRSFSFINQYFAKFNPDDCENLKFLKINLLGTEKIHLKFDQVSYMTHAPYTIEIDKSGKSISMKQTVS